MAEKKPTWYLLGLASSGGTDMNGFRLGWQYSGYSDIIMNINPTKGIWTGPGAGSLTLNRDGTVHIGDDIKSSSDKLMECGVIFVFQWKNPKMCLGGKFEWIGKGESEGEHHDVSNQNVVRKLEKPVGVTKKVNYWYEHGAKPGPCVVSRLLKLKSGVGGCIVTVDRARFCKVYDWASIGLDAG